MVSSPRLSRAAPLGAGLAAAAALLAALVAAAPLSASVELGDGASRATLEVDAAGEALVSWTADGKAESVLVPPSGELSHGTALGGPDVSRPVTVAGVPDAVALRRTPNGELWALQEIQLGAGMPVELDLSRWRGGVTLLTLALVGPRLEGEVSFHGSPVHGRSFTLAGRTPKIYVYIDCYDCGGTSGWSPMLGVAPDSSGHFAVYLRSSWTGSRYRATVAGPNIGSTLAPDAQTTISAG